MVKKIIGIKKQKESSEVMLARIKEDLKDRYTCYVLIACSPALGDGRMDVEMHFDGDEDLASMLVENAAQVFDVGESRRESQ